MVYVIRKNTYYQDLGNKRIDVGLNYIEEKNIDTPKEYALFGAGCCKGFIEKDVFFNDREGACAECIKRNKELINSIYESLQTK